MSKIHDDLFLKVSSESEDIIISDKTLSEDQIDFLFDQIDCMLLGINIDKKEPDKNKCIACMSEKLVIDNLK